MDVLVTGTAGFIGSHLAESLVWQGHRVRGVDALTPYYSAAVKLQNLQALVASDRMEFVHADLCDDDVDDLLDGIDVVFHQAGQPGVRRSWSDGFPSYVRANVLATQRLLEAARRRGVQRFVYASSSSVYGNAPSYPTRESDVPQPHSPYGVTKLAAEHLCSLYATNWGVPTVSLRYFTVYGPRQRPDMGFSRFVEAVLDDRAVPVYGDGHQIRDFTYVDDVVGANLAAAGADLPPGTVVNVAGGASTTVLEVLDLLGDVAGREVGISWLPSQAGDVAVTGGSIERAAALLGWSPQVGLAEGLARQVEWQASRPRPGSAAVTPLLRDRMLPEHQMAASD